MAKPSAPQHDRPAHEPHLGPDDEIVHVPKGTSRLRFLLTLALMVFVLVIFTVGDQLMGTFGQRPSSEAYMTWEHPTRGHQSLSVPKFMETRRALDSFAYVTTGQGLSDDAGLDSSVAYQIITERLAQEAGVEIPDVELGRKILEGEPGLVPAFLNPESYRAHLAARETSSQAFETVLRRVLRVRRYEMLVASALAQPTAEDLEKAWKDEHQEYSFELAGLAPADVRAEVEGSVPDADGLRAWYDGLSEGDKARLFLEQFLPASTSAALLSWPIGPTAPQALLDRFPRPESPTVDELATIYHARFGTVRFPAPAPETPTVPEGETPPPPPPVSARPLDEVREQAAVEAQVHAAFEALLRDLRAKAQAGESPDLAALAAELGLVLEDDGVQRTGDEWNEQKGATVGGLIALAQPGQIAPSTAVDASHITLVRVVERKASEAPPFEAVAEIAAAKWIDERATKLVDEKLKALSEKLALAAQPAPAADPEAQPEVPPAKVVDAETFAREVEAAGLTVVRQDWFDPARRAADLDSLPEVERFLRSTFYPGAEFFALPEGGIAGPAPSAQDERQWLVRLAGKRDPAELKISAQDYASLPQQALFMGLGDVLQEQRSLERLQRDFNLRFPAAEQQEAERKKQEAPASGT